MAVYFAIGLVMGLVTEWAAARLGLWRYRLAWMRFFNVAVTFGLVYGAIGYLLADQGIGWLFAAGAVPGLAIEAANEYGFRAWYFPGRSVPWLRGNMAVVVIGLGWGLVPPIAVACRGLLP